MALQQSVARTLTTIGLATALLSHLVASGAEPVFQPGTKAELLQETGAGE